MGHIPRKYTNVGKAEARMKADIWAANYAIKKLQEQAKNKPAPAPAPAPAAAPPPPPKEQSMAIEPVEYSPKIQQAKSMVNQYENKYKQGESPWEQAQANVQSSFIKPSTQSSASQQFDFGSNTFEAKESPNPKEQAQAAQNQMQNFISKYSQYKSLN
jgi:hypothetical protein